MLNLLRDYGLTDFYLELSTKDPEKFVGSDEAWEEATETLRQVARAGPAPGPRPGRRRLLRPEDLRPDQGRHRPHLADVDHQLDFNLPERFDLEYTGADGAKQSARS